MSLTLGQKLSHYEILAPIGKGGMGEVYRATDTRIDRTVAIKVLPSNLADNADLKERFAREARSISSLNHPHICTLYEFDSEGGTDFLVMEHLEGESLAARIARKGALPLEEALRYAVQIAEALDDAHRHGVTHRDLKPGNVMLTEPGAKLLDFGLATRLRQPVDRRLDEGGGFGGQELVSALPTVEKPLTAEGAILGTFQYMAPEQVEGREADAKTDVFAFGSLLYEMLTGQKAFEGKSQASMIAAILEREPAPVSSLRPLTPPVLDRIVKKCLAKDPAHRYHSAHDLADDIRWLGEPDHEEAHEKAPARTRRLRLALGVVTGILFGALSTALLLRVFSEPSRPQVTRFTVALPPGGALSSQLNSIAIAPDGARIVYASGGRIFVRDLDHLEPRALPGTEGNPSSPAFSPDGEWIAFWNRGALKKIALSGGAPVRLCDVDLPYGIVWGKDDVLRFGSLSSGIREVSSSGGAPELVLNPGGPVWRPQLLPDGRSYLFSMGNRAYLASYRLVIMAPGDAAPRLVLDGSDNVQYLASGHLLFHTTSNELLAAPFDPSQLALTGSPVPVVEGADWQFAVALGGTLVYIPAGSAADRTLVWVDRSGGVSPAVPERRAFQRPRLSPDGRRVAVEVWEGGARAREIWIYDLERGTRTRVTTGALTPFDPVWAPDGHRILFGRAAGEGAGGIYSKSADGSGNAELVLSSDISKDPHSFSPDGKLLAFYERRGDNRDIWILEPAGGGEPQPFAVTAFNERSPSFSPDGRFIAYTSDASGQDEIYVQPYPGPGPRTVVSTGGGREPVWSRAGGELFYRSGDQMLVVAVTTAPKFRAGVPEVLFAGAFLQEQGSTSGSQTYDVSPDGERFLMVERGDAGSELHVVVNWLDELKARLPGAR